jgi:cysteine desulfurase / selenocysteine lyase
MTIDVDTLRAATPGCAHVVHLDSAGASLASRATLERVVAHLRREAEVGGYAAEAEATDAIRSAREGLARLLGADPADVALAHSDTAGWVKAFWGLAASGWFDGGGRVLADRATYNSHYLSLLQARDRFDVSIEVVDARDDGSIDLDDLDRRLDTNVRLVTATHVGTHRGLVNPVEAVGARTRRVGVPYFLDACQSTGQLVVDVESIGCDVATGTGRKWLRGPRGTGFVYVRPEWSERMVPPGIDGQSASWVDADTYELGSRASRFEEFEASVAGRCGLGTAVAEALAIGIPAIEARISMLAATLRSALVDAGASVHDGGSRRCGIVTFSVPGHDPDDLKARFAARGVVVSVSSAPWARLDMASRGLSSVVRASPHAYNNEDDLGRLVAEVVALAPA